MQCYSSNAASIEYDESVIKVYTEKIHHKVYSLSNVILEKIVNIQMQNKDNEIKHTKVSDSLSIPLNSF